MRMCWRSWYSLCPAGNSDLLEVSKREPFVITLLGFQAQEAFISARHGVRPRWPRAERNSGTGIRFLSHNYTLGQRENTQS